MTIVKQLSYLRQRLQGLVEVPVEIDYRNLRMDRWEGEAYDDWLTSADLLAASPTRLAALTVLRINIAMVMGPTPPGTCGM